MSSFSVVTGCDQDCLTYHEDYKKLGVWTCDGTEGQRWIVAR
ncbi:hypothetical protein ACFWGM_27425 [Streptomyces roseolus]